VNRVPPSTNDPQSSRLIAASVARLERRLARLEKLIDEGLGAYFATKYPYGDGRTDDRWTTTRWSRRR
jgi:hypothetical protein